ncbi:PREDICTED: uncharacterized protein LOC106324969 isoform X2 [Brassica oleracea var. oleracea]|uniref:uncharacterized protein LOC106324969 isoform X2 n=1 Tax=Brassica oleracea var. oleracea TaxID=109376 RepID=UPI0006A72B0C|nr:PREDICTED: uncharacterized protein LOC106324969 isoform X2 [Brassica oleracea var. oleracea]
MIIVLSPEVRSFFEESNMAVSFPRLPRWLCGGGGGGGSTKKDSKGSSPSLKKTIKGKMGNVLFPEPDDPEWSIGWVEPHGPGFKSEDDTGGGGGFVVLVPCYKKVNQIPTGFLSPASDKKNMEQWLSSMGKL